MEYNPKLKKDIIQWDVKSWAPALKLWDEQVDWSRVYNCLELGGREGGLSLWLAHKGKKVVCSDLEDVKQTAEKLHLKYGKSAFIEYRDIDATSIPYENFFDVIVFKSIIGGIGYGNNFAMQQKAFAEIYKALKPGGKLLFAENLVASPFHQWLRKKFTSWGANWRYLSLTEMETFFKDYSSVQINTNGVLATFGRTEFQRNVLATFDKILLNHISPKSWHYIAYGIAEKK